MQHRVMLFALVALAAATNCAAHAQATRTWISGVGDDVNPCSRTAPCKTFAGAISKTATGGEIDALDPGGFGTVNITKSITIDGGAGQVGSILAAGAAGVIVQPDSTSVVTLRNLSIQGAGTGVVGIHMLSGKALHIENCAIANFNGTGIAIQTASGGQVFIDNTVSRDNQGDGLNISSSGANVRTSVTNSHFSNNNNGLVSADNSRTAVRNSDATGNASAGFAAAGVGGSATLSLTDSIAANNLVAGVLASGSATSSVRISNVSVFSNSIGFSAVLPFGTILSFGNNANPNPGVLPGLLAPE